MITRIASVPFKSASIGLVPRTVIVLLLLSFVTLSCSSGSRSHTGDLLEGLDDFAIAAMAEWNVPGMAIVVIQDGEEILKKGWGVTKEGGKAITPETLFGIGSTTKAFTSMAVGLLVDEGTLEWDRPVHDYMPDFRLQDWEATKKATVRDLLTHRVGISGHYAPFMLTGYSRDEIFERLRYYAPAAEFRKEQLYSNLMFLALGKLIERKSELTWEEFVEQRIFEPLRFSGSYTRRGDLFERNDIAMPHDNRFPQFFNDKAHSNDAGAPAGGIYSNMNDMSMWLALHLSGGVSGGKQFISSSSLYQMHNQRPDPKSADREAYAIENQLDEGPYGFGWMTRDYEGHYLVEHTGSSGGYTSLVRMLPAEGIGMVIVTNHRLGYNVYDPVSYFIMDRLLGHDDRDWLPRVRSAKERYEESQAERDARKHREKERTGTLSLSPEKYAGTFDHPGYGRLVLTFENNEISAEFNAIELGVLHNRERDTLEADLFLIPPFVFSLDAAGDVKGLYADFLEGMAEPVFFERTSSE